MTMSLESAAQAMREAMRETVKRHSLWYLVQGALMVLGGIIALFYPILSSFAVVLFLGWVLIISGIVQGISLIGAQNVPHFWLQLVSVVLSVIVGVLFLRHPGEGLLTLTLLLIVFFMIEGISKLIFALTIRPFPNWGWVMASGIILLDPSALLCNKSFLLLAQVGDAIPYFRPPLEPTGIDARDIILSASPTDLTVDLKCAAAPTPAAGNTSRILRS